MYEELLICFIPICPAPLGAPSGCSKIWNCWHLKKSAECNFEPGGPILAPRYLVSHGWRMGCFLWFPRYGSPLCCYGQHFHLTGYPYFNYADTDHVEVSCYLGPVVSHQVRVLVCLQCHSQADTLRRPAPPGRKPPTAAPGRGREVRVIVEYVL